ncbi:MAG: endonuclease domain-containing protein [Clostridiales Family XIII bacterium]|jgi:hypothetical protein|nr:endonuclease domain-containing protein [Clostridiales Family XIII bacterium]
MSSMKEFISHVSAARYWGVPYLEGIEATLPAGARRGEAAREITVFKPGQRYARKGCIVHLCESSLPKDAVVERKGQCIASPPFVFLQLATQWDLLHLILLGLQMGSHPPGKPHKTKAGVRRLEAFLEKTDGHRGHKRAVRALKYVANGSNSIMESLTYMMLSLPHSLGGYGLGKPLLNHGIPLGSAAQKRLGQKWCFVDLYYEDARLAVEYDSFLLHSTPEAQSRDMMRASALEAQGVQTLRFGTYQLYNKEACEEFAHNLAARIGKQIRIRTAKFPSAHDALRALLPQRPL